MKIITLVCTPACGYCVYMSVCSVYICVRSKPHTSRRQNSYETFLWQTILNIQCFPQRRGAELLLIHYNGLMCYTLLCRIYISVSIFTSCDFPDDFFADGMKLSSANLFSCVETYFFFL